VVPRPSSFAFSVENLASMLCAHVESGPNNARYRAMSILFDTMGSSLIFS